MDWFGLFVLCYAIGAFPSAYLTGRLTRGVDIRSLGDGNSGMANAFRELGVKTGLLVGFIDIGKGTFVVLLARWITGSETAALLAGLIAIAGHSWPVFLNFRGGRGAATALGVLLVLMPVPAIPMALVSVVFLYLSRNTTVYFAFVFAPMPLVSWLTGAPVSYIGYSLALPVLVGISHFLSLHRATLQTDTGVEQNAI